MTLSTKNVALALSGKSFYLSFTGTWALVQTLLYGSLQDTRPFCGHCVTTHNI